MHSVAASSLVTVKSQKQLNVHREGSKGTRHFLPQPPCSHTQRTQVGALDFSVTRLWGEATGHRQRVTEQQDEASLGSLSPCGLLTGVRLCSSWAPHPPDQEPPLSSSPTPTENCSSYGCSHLAERAP